MSIVVTHETLVMGAKIWISYNFHVLQNTGFFFLKKTFFPTIKNY